MEWDNQEQIAFAKILLRRWVQSQLFNSFPRILLLNYLISQLQTSKTNATSGLADYEGFLILGVHIQIEKVKKYIMLVWMYCYFDTVILSNLGFRIYFEIQQIASLSPQTSTPAGQRKNQDINNHTFPLFEETALVETPPSPCITSDSHLMVRKFYEDIKILISVIYFFSLTSYFLSVCSVGEMLCSRKPVTS